VLEGTGVDAAATPDVLDDGAAVVLVLVAIDDANALLLEAAGIGVEVAGVFVFSIPFTIPWSTLDQNASAIAFTAIELAEAVSA